MAVERCICHQIHFKDILEIAEQKGITTVEELQKQKISCTNCRLCVPYVRRVLESGTTHFRPDFLRERENNL
ncbi:MAG: hypothetical protein WD604_06915 [Balneolaceae bacterium]